MVGGGPQFGGWTSVTTFGNWKDLLLVPTVGNMLYAFNVESLEVVWRFVIGHGPPYAEPVVAGDRIYLSAPGATTIAGENEIICLDASTGQVVWRTEAGRPGQFFCHPPAIWRDRLIVPEDRYDRTAFSLNASDGSLIWRIGLGREHENSKVTYGFNCKPLVIGDVVYVSSPDGCLYAIAAEDGKIIWRTCTEGAIEAPPLLSHGLLFLGSNDGCVYAIQPESGQICSKYWASGSIWTTPSVHGNMLLFYTSMEMQAWLHAVQIVD
jgi:outer membrane protein assembly factor BamB